MLDAVLLAYSFMVSALFVPAPGGLVWKRATSAGMLAAMLSGGTLAVVFGLAPSLSPVPEPTPLCIGLSALAFVSVSRRGPAPAREPALE